MKKIIVIFSILILTVTSLYADLVAQVTKGVISKPLVSVMTNDSTDNFAAQVDSIVATDLNQNAKLSANQSIKYAISEKHQIPWKNMKADYSVLLKYTKNSYNNYTVEVELLKRNNTSYIKSVTYKNINVSLVRILSHKIAKYVYQQITGEQGFFLTKLAYVKVTNPYSRYGRIYELVISDYDGYNQHTVIRQEDNPIATPSWSNDGRYVVYSSYNGGSMAVYRLEISTGNITRISNYKGINSSPSYSPDDKSIALALSKGYSEETNIYIMNLYTKSLKRLTINGINTAPKFSPDGRSVVFTSNRGSGRPNIYVAPVYSKYPQSTALSTRIYEGFDPVYTPDNKNIVFMYQKGRSMGTQIAVYDLSTNSLKTITHGKADSSPTVSPYGDMVAYASTSSRGGNSLDMVSLDGENHFVINNIGNAKMLIQSPAWSPKNF